MEKLVIYSNDELKKIQSLEMKILKELIRICEELDIEYFADGGTALGAVRHRGFIPWDDDIDVFMTRDNYVRFLNEAPKILAKNMHIVTPYNDKKCPYLYAKIRLDGTKFIEYANRKVKTHQGVYIDIFPFDEVPDDEKMNIKQNKQIVRIMRIFSLRQSPDVSAKPETLKEHVLSLLRKVLHYFCMIIPYDWIINKADKMMTMYNGTNQKAYVGLTYPIRNGDYILKSTMYPIKELEFEDISVKLTNNYDEYLTNLYGDYMEYPPEKQRFGHKPWKIEI